MVRVLAPLVVPTVRVVNVWLVGTATTGAIAFPIRATVGGLPEALSAIVKDAARLPTAEGVKVTVILQLSPTPSVFGLMGQFPPAAKSDAYVPENPISLIFRGTSCAFVSTTVCVALVVPSGTVPNDSSIGNRVTGATPVPVKAADCGLLDALSVTFSVAVQLPIIDGVNTTVMLQLCPAPSVFGLIGQFPLSA